MGRSEIRDSANPARTPGPAGRGLLALSPIVSGPPERPFQNPDRCGRVIKVYNGGRRKGPNRPPEVSNPDQTGSKSAQNRSKPGLPILPKPEKTALALAPMRFSGPGGIKSGEFHPLVYTIVYSNCTALLCTIVAVAGRGIVTFGRRSPRARHVEDSPWRALPLWRRGLGRRF